MERHGDVDADSDSITRLIANYQVSYLLIDQNRYAGAPLSPMAHFVAEHPELAHEVWRSDIGRECVIIYEVATEGQSRDPERFAITGFR